MRLKDRIADEAALTQVVHARISEFTHQVRAEVGPLEDDYIRFKRNQKIGYGLIMGAFVVPQFLSGASVLFFVSPASELYRIPAFVILAISFVACLYYGFKLALTGTAVIERFNEGTNSVLFSKVFSLLGVPGTLISQTAPKGDQENVSIMPWLPRGGKVQTPQAEAALERLRQSELITEPFNTTLVDNLFELNVAGAAVQGSELDIQHVTGSGKNRSVKNIFKGYFISCNLDRTLQGKTFVSTEGDTYGFAHRTFWGGDVVETTLEWNQFEELLHVATNNEVEARYVLTTNFMSDLYDWWHTKSTNIRISFIGNQLCLLFPDDKIRLNDTLAKISEAEVEEYLLTIAKPLLHVVHLIEEVRL